MIATNPQDFEYLEIGLASPDKIRYWSYGEVEKPETINYRTFKPERKGLFCERIFGPVKDWECSCGKYRRIRYRGIVCERCGVEVTHSKVRRERMGHIELAAPVAHIWFLKGVPGYLGVVLDYTTRQLEEVIYFDNYIVTEANRADLPYKVGDILKVDEYYEAKEEYGAAITAKMGAGAIKELLEKIDYDQLTRLLSDELVGSKGQKKIKVTKRLRIINALKKSGNRPEWMILENIPIMPPDLRPMVQLEGGRFATSDLNDLYRRVVNRNNRLKRLMDIGAPDMIIRNEKRMLQESVDVLIANGKRGRAVTGNNGRPLKSLGNIIEGKQGRFRQNLLGKRVDYSGRSVIVVGPHLKFNQCGLPKEMAVELFKPFIICELVKTGYVTNVKSAKRKIEERDVHVWDVLEKIIKGRPVLLNRAPTLHRLGIQAFDPVLVEGSAIQVHPLVCTAFNADFDGDQMAVHVPLSIEAQTECRLLILSTNNILSPTNGRSIITPTQDMVLGCYFLTVEDPAVTLGEGKFFFSVDEALRAWERKIIDFHSDIHVYIDKKRIKTTVGRVIFNQAIRGVYDKFNLEYPPFINETVGKKALGDFIYNWFLEHGNLVVSEISDALKTTGFHYATLSGISISISDLRIPKNKSEIINDSEEQISKIKEMLESGQISTAEATLRGHEVWRTATSKISDQMEDEFGSLNNIFIMANSGARGNIDQVRQLAGMRGLMSDAQGRTIEVPIKANFKEGLSLAEYFISCYGARKGLVDTALRTADSGYLTRRLVDVAQDITISRSDCGTVNSIDMSALIDGTDILVPVSDMIEGRVAAEDVKDPQSAGYLVEKGELISRKKANVIQSAGIESVKVRTPVTCEAARGICQQCYGADLASAKLVDIGEAVGIIAAQSIGEPGTQLTMRTFHTGGVDLRKASLVTKKADSNAKVIFSGITLSNVKHSSVTDWEWVNIVNAKIILDSGDRKVVYVVPRGAILDVKDGEKVSAGQDLFRYDPMYSYDVVGGAGLVKYSDKLSKLKGFKLYEPLETEIDLLVIDNNQVAEISVSERDAMDLVEGEFLPASMISLYRDQLSVVGIVSKCSKPKDGIVKVQVTSAQKYIFQAGAILQVENGQQVSAGDVISIRWMFENTSLTKDIVQGLPRVEELFEARRYQENSILSQVSGCAIVSKDLKGHVLVTVITDSGELVDHKIAAPETISVSSGQFVKKGESLTAGIVNPHDILETRGILETQKYLVSEVQRVYRSQGVSIHSKHVEVIVKQMIRKVLVTDPGDSEFITNSVVELYRFTNVNKALLGDSKTPATGTHVLLGITRSSLATDSFISAASFQETAKILSQAAIAGEKDYLYGLKENVIIGRLIPAGTGFSGLSEFELVSNTGEELSFSEEDLVFS